MGLLRQLSQRVAEPLKSLDYERGYEDFRFPATRRLLALPPEPPTIVHLHNLHGGYFDLLTREGKPVEAEASQRR